MTATKKLTAPQRRMLTALVGDQPLFYVRGAADVRVARALESLGLATLTDDGSLVDGRNIDGERWSVRVTDAGRAAIKAGAP